MNALTTLLLTAALAASAPAFAQKYTGGDGKLRVTLAKQPFSPNGTSKGPDTMAGGGIQKILADLGATVRVEEAALTPRKTRSTADGSGSAWRSGTTRTSSPGTRRAAISPSDCSPPAPRCLGMVAGLQKTGPTLEPIRIGMLWLDAHPDFNTPDTTRSGSLGGMPVAVATGRALPVHAA